MVIERDNTQKSQRKLFERIGKRNLIIMASVLIIGLAVWLNWMLLSPEEGFDCDNNKFVINGGIMIGTGGATSNPTSATQPYSAVSSVTVTSGKYLSVKDSSGNVLFSYKCPNSVNNATVLMTSPQFTKTSHTLMYGVTSVADAAETLFDGVYSVGGTVTGGSSKTFTPATK